MLIVIMLIVIMLSAIMLIVIMLIVIMQIVTMLSSIMLIVIILDVVVLCSVPSHYGNCSYTVITLGVVMLSGITPYTVVVNFIKVLLHVP